MTESTSWVPTSPVGSLSDPLHQTILTGPALQAPETNIVSFSKDNDLSGLAGVGLNNSSSSTTGVNADYSRDQYIKTIDTIIYSTTSSQQSINTHFDVPSQKNSTVSADASIATKNSQTLNLKSLNGLSQVSGNIASQSMNTFGSMLLVDSDIPIANIGNGTFGDTDGGYDGSNNSETINVSGNPTSTTAGGNYNPGNSGAASFEPGAGGPSSRPEQIEVIGRRNGFDHVVQINGTDYLSNGHGGIISSSQISGDTVTITPVPLKKLNEITTKLYQDFYGRIPTDSDRLWISQQLSDDGKTWKQIRDYEASNDEARAVDAQTWGVIHGRGAQEADVNYAVQMMQNGATLQQYRTEEAHDDQAVADIGNFYKIILGRDVDPGGLKTYTDALGTTMERGDVTNAIGGSNEATNQINGFLQKSYGVVTDEMRHTGAVILGKIAEVYQTIQYDSSDEIHALANSYKTSFSPGNILQSIMPTTWQGWLGLVATVAIDLTPPGEVVAAGEILGMGGAKLLDEVVTVVESRIIKDETTGAISVQTGTGQEHAIEDVAHKIGYGHAAEKHITDKHGENFSLTSEGILDSAELEKYIYDTIEGVANKNPRYEFGDLGGDGLKIWDNDTDIMTILDPNASDFGTAYKPVNGKPYFQGYGEKK